MGKKLSLFGLCTVHWLRDALKEWNEKKKRVFKGCITWVAAKVNALVLLYFCMREYIVRKRVKMFIFFFEDYKENKEK